MAPLAVSPVKFEQPVLSVPREAKESTKSSSRSAAKTPTRIPLPVSKTPRHTLENSFAAGSEDDLLSFSETERDRSNSTEPAVKQKKQHTVKERNSYSNSNGELHPMTAAAKVGPTTTVYSGSIVISSSTSTASSRYPRSAKPTPNSSTRTTKSTKLTAPASTTRPQKTTSTTISTTTNNIQESHPPRQRKVSTVSSSKTSSRRRSLVNDILQEQMDKERHKSQALTANLVSAHGLISPPESINGSRNDNINNNNQTMSRRKHTLLHERLQGLVDEGSAGSLVEREKRLKPHRETSTEVTVLRGGGNNSTGTTANAKDEMADLVAAERDQTTKHVREKEKSIRAPMSPQSTWSSSSVCFH